MLLVLTNYPTLFTGVENYRTKARAIDKHRVHGLQAGTATMVVKLSKRLTIVGFRCEHMHFILNQNRIFEYIININSNVMDS